MKAVYKIIIKVDALEAIELDSAAIVEQHFMELLESLKNKDGEFTIDKSFEDEEDTNK